MHLFYVQGGGLGHLTRIDKLIRFLDLNKKDIVIITPSCFTEYFKQYTFIQLSWNSTIIEWIEIISNTITINNVESFYIDAFPFGIKGELFPVYEQFKTINYIYIARILKWGNYIKNMPQLLKANYSNTLVLETVYSNHYMWIKQNSKTITKIEASHMYNNNEQVPLIESSYYLIVHSGGKKDVIELCTKVAQELKDSTIPIFVVTQVNLKINNPKFIIKPKIYPVSQYFKYAKHIFTGVGFNLVNELKPYRYKHTMFPFNKLYDDQLFRKKHTI